MMEASIGVNLRVTAHSNQGGRKYMEDMFCVAYQPTADDKDLLYAYFGIFDGHGGREAALYAKHHLMDHIVQQKNFWSDDDELVKKAIREGFITTHLAMWKELEKWPKTPSGLPSTSGTTASIAFVRRGKLYIGHVGDSGIVMGYEDPETGFWRAKPLTKDHKPESPAETTRITEAGGKVIVKSGVHRVVWNRPRIGHKGPVRRSTLIDEIPFLAVARSLGDLWSYNSKQNKFVVSPKPDVSVLEIDVHSHRCLVLGTDGLWNMLSPQDAVNSVYFSEKSNERQPHQSHGAHDPLLSKSWINPSKRLVDRALDRWFQHSLRADNTSVVTVVVDPPGPPKRNHAIRHSFSSTQDPTSSPVGISRYVPQNKYFAHGAIVGSVGSMSPSKLRDSDPGMRPSSSTVPMNARSPSISHPRVITKTPTADRSSPTVSSAPRPRRAKPTRSSERPKRGSQASPTRQDAVNAEPIVQSSPAVSAFCAPHRPWRESHNRNSSTSENDNRRQSTTNDDVQIHEVSSSSETGKADENATVKRKRKGQKPDKNMKKPRVDQVGRRPNTRHSLSQNALSSESCNPAKPISTRITKKMSLEDDVSLNSKRSSSAQSKPHVGKKPSNPEKKVMKGRVEKKNDRLPLVLKRTAAENGRSLRSTSKAAGRVLRSRGK